ncbi:MFS transporter [Spongiactinospora sp. TRM90649]|uniref:MFS transporter n=1 Tax=Spongiactinospora sp. TRM90649 TaxID=3031114 RepID=UPI0023FA3E68|nr:MFS transporter [Spongiactinospora sp. TRM90649]MDF5753911.1 MFS transporter [Spongiactinospora sp. TRM90649]
MRAQLPLRLTRAAAFSAVCVLLAALGHRLAGGAGPVPWAMGAGGGGALLAALALAGRERRATTIIPVLMVLQLGLHELFSLASGASSSLTPHGLLGLDISYGPQPLDAAHGHVPSPGGASIGMLTAHLTASLITGLWLARGESALWSLLRHLAVTARRAGSAVAARLLVGPLIAEPPPAVRLPADRPRVLPRHGATLRGTVTRRGPPLPRPLTALP